MSSVETVRLLEHSGISIGHLWCRTRTQADCSSTQLLKANKTGCRTRTQADCSSTRVLKANKTGCRTRTQADCSSTQVLKADKTGCETKQAVPAATAAMAPASSSAPAPVQTCQPKPDWSTSSYYKRRCATFKTAAQCGNQNNWLSKRCEMKPSCPEINGKIFKLDNGQCRNFMLQTVTRLVRTCGCK